MATTPRVTKEKVMTGREWMKMISGRPKTRAKIWKGEVHTCIYATAEFTYGCTIAHCTLVLLLYSEVMMEEIAMLLVPVSL